MLLMVMMIKLRACESSMGQTKQLIYTLKRSIKVHCLSYSDLARQLTLSEVSVKRLFAEASFSLDGNFRFGFADE